ncbi:6-phosphofructokinase [Clostridium senegalense]|uniref:Pyrophosphate--fructose 6-phosphate 1-phosphotransferase n=1 Tax=Clostridium senegalense TaxID=1465809 RepID=A0A6M0H213_9CLOT|nr:6-phosphofructokinase [Clostridium senegalense]NEU04629.1 6-phosphofructokinase [Clostridium senegalense]
MKNCLIAQSGGPTSVINSSVIGVFEKNLTYKKFDSVYAGINGIEGILNENIVNLSEINKDIVCNLKYTPSSGLGSCRYKLENANSSKEEYIKLFELLSKYHIDTFFYIGGNDSMDTVNKLSIFGKEINSNIKFIGIPKTIDNDLDVMDHTPGFGSAAKFIATTALENSLDADVYNTKNVFIIESMGRDTGWLAASATIARINNRPVVDFIYIPEMPFDKVKFLYDVKKKLEVKNTVTIVVSEGLRDKDGKFISQMNSFGTDKFGHAQLGGVANYLKNLLKQSGVKKVRAVELSTLQRCSMHYASQRDIEEAYNLGEFALENCENIESGYMVAIKRVNNIPYESEVFTLSTSLVANKVKYFPKNWINSECNNVTDEAYEYTLPLIFGEPKIQYENGLPKYVKIK